MIIGNGMIAKAFASYQDNDDVCIFASGVSNSRETRASEFHREFDLVTKALHEHREKTFVYFSTCSIDDNASNLSLYVEHKKKIEEYIVSASNNYYIFRVTQIVGYTKNQTLVSGLLRMILEDRDITLLGKSTRNLIDIEDVYKIVDFFIKHHLYKNSITHIASPFFITPLEIVEHLEEILQKKARYTVIDEGDVCIVDLARMQTHLGDINITFPETYSRDIIYKYVKSSADY